MAGNLPLWERAMRANRGHGPLPQSAHRLPIQIVPTLRGGTHWQDALHPYIDF